MAREMKASPSGEKKLEQYGVWVKVEPQEVPESGQGEGTFELSDLESSGAESGGTAVATAEETLTPEEEELLDELETELSPDEPAPQREVSASSRDELSLEPLGEALGAEFPELAIDEQPSLMEEDVLELPTDAFPSEESGITEEAAELSLDDAGSSVEVPLSEEIPQEEHFDDLKALEDELATVTASTSAAPSQSARAQSAEILARIEEELRTIRSDLTGLKRELAVLRKPGGAASGKAAAEGESGGFFDEDEDDTIALTGDELDNILNTAEITEEPAAGAVVEPETPEDLGDAPGLSEDGVSVPEDVDILSYDMEPAAQPERPRGRKAAVEPEPEGIPDLELDTLGMDEEGPSARAPAEPALDLESLEAAEEPASLELESLDAEEAIALDLDTGEEPASVHAPAAMDDLAAELEGLPEIDLEEEVAPARTSARHPAAPVDELEIESIGETEALSDSAESLEALPEMEELEEEGGTPASDAEELPAELDLQALAGDADEGLTAVEDATELSVDELEALPEVETQQGDAEKEIEIDFEEQPTAEAAPEDVLEAEEVLAEEPAGGAAPVRAPGSPAIPEDLKDDIRSVLKYMDQLLEALPEEKIQEFANSEYFVMYKKLFEDLGLGE